MHIGDKSSVVGDTAASDVVQPLELEGAVGPAPASPDVYLDELSQDTLLASESSNLSPPRNAARAGALIYEDISEDEISSPLVIFSPIASRSVSPMRSPFSPISPTPMRYEYDDEDSSDSIPFFDQRSQPLSVSSAELSVRSLSPPDLPKSPKSRPLKFGYYPHRYQTKFHQTSSPAPLRLPSPNIVSPAARAPARTQTRPDDDVRPSTSGSGLRRSLTSSILETLPSTNRNWFLYLKELEEAKRRRHERMRHSGQESASDFVKRFDFDGC